MIYDIQKAALTKRMAAFLLDIILIIVLATGFSYLLSLVTNYDQYNEELQTIYDELYEKYDITTDEEEFNSYNEEQLAEYNEKVNQANAELIKNDRAQWLYQTRISLIFLITGVGILLGLSAIEIVFPLIFKNGQTPGKKIFSLAVVRNDSVKIGNFQLFVRAILGKYTLEIMVPVYLVIMLLFGLIDVVGTIILIAYSILQLILLFFTKNKTVVHDLLSSTVVVDNQSQKIFDSAEAKLEYIKKSHLEEVSKH